MKTIIELREEAIKQDKNIEFYLYQLLEEQQEEIERLNNIINEIEKYLEIGIDNCEKNYNLFNSTYIATCQASYELVLTKLKELKENSK